MKLKEDIMRYVPVNEQEEKDQKTMLAWMERDQDLFTRDNEVAHFTASAWVVNPSRDKVLMAYHRIYDSWAWLGGHADGNEDLLEVALKEVKEEAGVKEVKVVSDEIYSLEILTVEGHIKKGKYVSSHLHMNVTYLLEVDDTQYISHNPEENSDVGWFELDEAVEKSTEPWFQETIYKKLNKKLREQSAL